MSQINKTGNDKSQARKTKIFTPKTAATTTVMKSIQIGTVLNFVYLSRPMRVSDTVTH